jgi:hypothetical protein
MILKKYKNNNLSTIVLPSLNVIDQSEVFVGFFGLDDVHEAGGELGIGPDLAVDLKHNFFYFFFK